MGCSGPSRYDAHRKGFDRLRVLTAFVCYRVSSSLDGKRFLRRVFFAQGKFIYREYLVSLFQSGSRYLNTSHILTGLCCTTSRYTGSTRKISTHSVFSITICLNPTSFGALEGEFVQVNVAIFLCVYLPDDYWII